ncbi:uncharacterized protein C5orf47 homolog [Prionailurus bengalensis]|uniref:uncharacterized protein C5orf47 homolog n=1 Tax=Prionailurus bengalensis TaxID=37029 RepID=UPI001CA9DAC2|nr:uncharacterized protein C5orf47 homolog [Prionailurus bengalensis]
MAAAGREQERDLARFVYVTRFGSHRCGGVLQLGRRRARGRGSTGRGAGCSPEEPRAAARAGAELVPGPRAPAASPPAPASSARSCPRAAARAAVARGPRPAARGLGAGRSTGAVGGQAPPPVSPAADAGGRKTGPSRARRHACGGEGAQGHTPVITRYIITSARAQETFIIVFVLRIVNPLKYVLALIVCLSLSLFLKLGLTQKNLAKQFDFPIPLNEAPKVMKKKKKVRVWNKVYKVISRMLEENEKYRLRLKYQQLSSESKLTQLIV